MIIALTDADGSSEWINFDHVMNFYANTFVRDEKVVHGTTMEMSDGSVVSVREAPLQILDELGLISQALAERKRVEAKQ